MSKEIEILKNRKAFDEVESIKNTAAYRAGKAHKDAANEFDRLQRELYKIR